VHRFVIALALTTACLAWDASSAHALTCRNRLVTVGDPMARVLSLCGEPTTVSERVVHRQREVHRVVRPGVVVTDTISVAVTLTEWVYDFGPTRLMRQLVFEDGTVRVIDTLGYGSPSGRSASVAPRTRDLPTAAVHRRDERLSAARG
jgi:hypothetical protein